MKVFDIWRITGVYMLNVMSLCWPLTLAGAGSRGSTEVFSSKERARQPCGDVCPLIMWWPSVVQNKVRLNVRPHAADVTAGDFHQLQHLLSFPTRTAGTFALLSAALLIKQMDQITSSRLRNNQTAIFCFILRTAAFVINYRFFSWLS